jgi:hypothetical protein
VDAKLTAGPAAGRARAPATSREEMMKNRMIVWVAKMSEVKLRGYRFADAGKGIIQYSHFLYTSQASISPVPIRRSAYSGFILRASNFSSPYIVMDNDRLYGRERVTCWIALHCTDRKVHDGRPMFSVACLAFEYICIEQSFVEQAPTASSDP